MSAPLRALLQFDLLRLREFARRLKSDAGSATVVLLLAGGGAIGLLIGLDRLGRERLVDHPGVAAAAGAALGVSLVLAQRGAARRMADGPFGPALAAPQLRLVWSATRVVAAALAPAAALALGAVRAGDPEAALAVLGGLALAVALALAAPVLSVRPPLPPAGPAQPAPSHGGPVLLALRTRAGGLPRWLLFVGAAGACAVLAGLAQANDNPAAVHALLFGGALACGALAAPAPDLFAFLARTPKPLARLLLDFAVKPAATGLLAGAAALAVPGGGVGDAAAVAAGVLVCGLTLAVVHLNRLAYGPVAGPPRLSIYAGLAAIGALALGPFALLFAVAGLVLLARTAARRRWSAA